jgi:hypothetical protein
MLRARGLWKDPEPVEEVTEAPKAEAPKSLFKQQPVQPGQRPTIQQQPVNKSGKAVKPDVAPKSITKVEPVKK